MTITINYEPRESPGYTPHKSVTLHNVASVEDQGPRMVRVHMMFTDFSPTHDHVVSVVVIPAKETA